MNPLRYAVTEYVAMRRALGYQMNAAEAALGKFVSFLEKRGAPFITSKLAVEWAQLPSKAQPASWARRLCFVRGFARYRSAVDPRTEIPPWGLLPHQSGRAKPYLYTDEEIRSLLRAALRLPPIGGLRPWTYCCLFGILAVTGMRISEVVSLRIQDVDMKEGVLSIHRTKFGKSRLVPIHSSTQQMLTTFALRRDQLLRGLTTRKFLVSDHGRTLKESTVRYTFNKLSRQIGLRAPSAHQGPRLHDFRHRFALTTLISWYRSGQDVEQRLPILSTYLGHANVASTYWYLALCPELMGLSTARLERRWEGRL